jgi:hypothetical protein
VIKSSNFKQFIAVAALAAFEAASANCMSHSTEIPLGKDVCFAASMRQYSCMKVRGNFGLDFVQRFSMKSSLKNCYHVDHTNDKPATDNLLSKAELGSYVLAELSGLQKITP